MVPTGQTGLIISFLTDYELFNKIDLAGWYKEFVFEIDHDEMKGLEIHYSSDKKQS
jgi:hypothetical protein